MDAESNLNQMTCYRSFSIQVVSGKLYCMNKGTCLIFLLVFTAASAQAQGTTWKRKSPQYQENMMKRQAQRNQRYEKNSNASDREDKSMISPAAAKKIAEATYGGKALSATLKGSGENAKYQVKLIQDGRITFVTIDAYR